MDANDPKFLIGYTVGLACMVIGYAAGVPPPVITAAGVASIILAISFNDGRWS